MFASLRCPSSYRLHQTQQRTLDSRAGHRHLVAMLGQRWRVGHGEGARLADHGSRQGVPAQPLCDRGQVPRIGATPPTTMLAGCMRGPSPCVMDDDELSKA